nr:Zn-dependent hydrolase [uncultured Dethiosulfovibrio sp.]
MYLSKGVMAMFSGFDLCLDVIKKVNLHGKDLAGGFSRLAFREEDRMAREELMALMRALGFSLEVDRVGNIIGTLGNMGDGFPPVALGSHIDTVPQGGPYDGVLGVAMAIGAAKEIRENNPNHRYPLQVMVFSGEESSRFGIANVGSKAITGYLTLKDCFSYKDDDGVILFKAMRDFGLSPEWMGRSRLLPSSLKAFFEVHIEQGPFLHRSGIDVGVVEAIAAPTRMAVDIEGRADHSGACPMNMRKDALAAASEIVLAVESVGVDEYLYGTVATVGVCRIEPGAMNVVPGKAHLKIDLRGIKKESLERAYERIRSAIEGICSSRGVKLNFNLLSKGDPVVLDGGLRRLLGKVCDDLGLRWTDMPSGAGHDAMYVASSIPTAMIFVPCVEGISHNPSEEVELDRIRPGYRALVGALERIMEK